MDSNVRRPPNALKHGAFSRIVLFPWEDEGEYEKIERDLREEWAPCGAFEEDAVFTILTCIWRKRRIREKRNFDVKAALEAPDMQIFTRKPPPFFEAGIELTKYLISNREPSPAVRNLDKVHQLLGFSTSLYGNLDSQFLPLLISMIGGEIAEELNREVPEDKFSTTPEWVRALKSHIDDVMLPAARAQAGEGNASAAKAAEFLTIDRVLEDITAEERLDAMMDRAIRRLSQAKVLKQMTGLQRSEVWVDRQPKQIETKPPAKSKVRKVSKKST